MSEIQTPDEVSYICLKAVGNLAYLMSTIRNGDKLTEQETEIILTTIAELESESKRVFNLQSQLAASQVRVKDLELRQTLACKQINAMKEMLADQDKENFRLDGLLKEIEEHKHFTYSNGSNTITFVCGACDEKCAIAARRKEKGERRKEK